jgi:threonine dehydrogenase-like Zn-dependent dehydrogenase
MVAGARAKTPAHVIALDMAPQKLELAKECGADMVINIASEDAVAQVMDVTDGYGADVYLEGTGHPSAVIQGLNLLRKLGTYVEYGVFGSDVTVDWSIISDDKELNVLGAHLGPYCWPAAIRMIESGVLPMDKICTHQLPLAEFQKGLDLVSSGTESVKVSLIP